MQTLSLQRLTYSRRKQSHDVNAPISFLIKKSGSALINGTITLLPKPLCLYLCASEPKILTADCFSPHAPGQILDGVTRYKSLTCSSSATKPSLCVWENVSEWTRSNCFSRLWGRKGKSVCLHSSFLNLKWAFIVLGLHFRNHPFSNSDGWCQEIWGGLSHFFPQCKFQMEAMQIFLARMLLISLLQNLSLLYYTLWSSLLTGHFIHC